MDISINGQTYTVKENQKSWTLKHNANYITLNINVSKVDCPTFDDLKSYAEEKLSIIKI